jgi:hypothetical protein
MWKQQGIAVQAACNNTTRRMRIACWITKATNTRSEYVILIHFPQQQRLRESASMLRYTRTSIASHVYFRVKDVPSLTYSLSTPLKKNQQGEALVE